MIRPVNHKQFYQHLNTNKLRKTQTIQKSYIRKKPIIEQDERFIEYRHTVKQYSDILKEMSKRFEQLEEKSKQIVIIFIEHSIGRPMTEEEKRKLKVLVL